MMSNPPSALQQRQRLHRRQNSTPVAFEALKVPNMPPTTQRPNTHRRGQSFDQRSPVRRQFQQGSMVSITNTGSIQPGQQILRETQQQRIARPGQQHIEISQSPQCGLYSPTGPSAPGTPYENMTTMNAIMQPSGSMQIAHSPYYNQEMDMPLPAGLDGMGFSLDENNQHYFQHLQNMHSQIGLNMIPERRMSQPELRVHTQMRPYTPTQQIQSAQFPLTPATTPFNHHNQMGYARSLQSSPTRAHTDENIRAPNPISMQRGRSLQGIVESEEFHHVSPSPPTTAPIFRTNTFEVAEIPIPESFSSQSEPTKSMPDSAPHVSSHPSPGAPGPAFHATFEPANDETLPFFDEMAGEGPSLAANPVPVLTNQRGKAGSASPTRPALSPRRMSISDLNLEPGIEASIEETNVSLDDIAQYIEGPDPVDNKWICKFDDCDKRFGRKENIKSHVQTHLGDRQFRCDHCKKCFVRGHDLKRHAKIHTGTKPYPCLCGNAFARHDALTRHRQRGMCIGAFDGVVKKVIKRGRPRKHRPEMDERLDKASRTRKQANEYDHHYASSDSSGSMSSWGSPPTETMESLSIRGNSPFDDMALFGVPQSQMNMVENIGLPPDMFSFTPPASPGYSCGNHPSPSHRSLTPTDTADIHELPPNAMSFVASHMAIQHSQHSLPSLSHSSSSPAADIAAFDFSDDPMTHIQRIGMKVESDRNEFDTFLDYGNIEMNMDSGTVDNFFGM